MEKRNRRKNIPSPLHIFQFPEMQSPVEEHVSMNWRGTPTTTASSPPFHHFQQPYQFQHNDFLLPGNCEVNACCCGPLATTPPQCILETTNHNNNLSTQVFQYQSVHMPPPPVSTPIPMSQKQIRFDCGSSVDTVDSAYSTASYSAPTSPLFQFQPQPFTQIQAQPPPPEPPAYGTYVNGLWMPPPQQQPIQMQYHSFDGGEGKEERSPPPPIVLPPFYPFYMSNGIEGFPPSPQGHMIMHLPPQGQGQGQMVMHVPPPQGPIMIHAPPQLQAPGQMIIHMQPQGQYDPMMMHPPPQTQGPMQINILSPPQEQGPMNMKVPPPPQAQPPLNFQLLSSPQQQKKRNHNRSQRIPLRSPQGQDLLKMQTPSIPQGNHPMNIQIPSPPQGKGPMNTNVLAPQGHGLVKTASPTQEGERQSPMEKDIGSHPLQDGKKNQRRSRSHGKKTSKHLPFCGFCYRNGEAQKFYRSHPIKDEFGKTSCPILRKYSCPICHATGDTAHTVGYCPKGSGENAAEGKNNFRTPFVHICRRNAKGVIGAYSY